VFNNTQMPEWYYKDKIIIGQFADRHTPDIGDLRKAGSKSNLLVSAPLIKDTALTSAKKSPRDSKAGRKDSEQKLTLGISRMGTQDVAKDDDCGGSFATKMFAKLKSGTK
jgi:hypothetical protein